MDFDVFLSYPHADRAEVMQIYEALRARELTVWVDEDISDYASITRSIVGGLARSRVLLAYYSRNYSRSRACQWELTAAFLAAQHEGDPRRRVLVINPENEWGHIQPVELKDAEVPDSDDLDRLVSSVKARVDEIEGTIGEIHALKPPVWYGRKGVGSNRFVGRLPYLWQIHSALHATDFPIITGATAAYEVAQVYGMGGVGKSLLAEEYALRFAAAFHGGVFWLSAFGNDDAKAGLDVEGREAERSGQIRRIAADLGIPVQDKSPEEIEGALKWKLGSLQKPFLWVVDDLPSEMDVKTLHRWIAPHPMGKTLITTRSLEYASLGSPLIPLGVLEPVEAYELLTSRRVPPGAEEENAAHKLLKDLGYHALAVDVAGAAIRESISSTPFADFVNALANPTEDELEFAKDLIDILPMGHETSIASTFLCSIKEVGSEGLDFLRLASRLAVAPIPASLVLSVFREVDGLDEIAGKRRATLATHGAKELSLAERVEGGDVTFLVHTLISRTIRFRDRAPERSGELEDAAVRVLTDECLKVNDPITYHKLELIVAHARTLMSGSDNLQRAELMGCFALYDHHRGARKSAENFWRREWEIRNRICGGEDPKTLATMNNLALALKAQGDLVGARKLEEQVIGIKRRILGDEHPNTLKTMNNLARTLSYQGDLGGARRIQEEVLEIRRRTLGDEHLDTRTSMHSLASTLESQGDCAGAREIRRRFSI